jgi:galactokinase/mevalonate kinase-like predicted kinase
MERMELTSNCCFSTPTTTSSLRENEADIRSSSSRCAWIDTGVTIFSPLAASMLYELARRHLQRCTAIGLQAAYDQYRRNSHIVSQNSDEEVPTTSYSSVTEYAAQNAMSVDLYTHFLQALSLSQETVDVQMERRSTFIQQYSRDLPFDTITAIWDAFSSCTLQVLVLPHGRFWHLGTTLELHDFLVDACSTRIPDATWTNRQRQCQDFGSRLGLNRRLRAYTILGGNYDGSSCVDPSAVIYDSVVAVRQQNSTNSRSSVGARTVIEHCDVDIIDGTVCIGKNCLVSGLRIPSHLKYSGNVVIPDNMVVQMVQLNESKRLEGELSFVVIVLGINDEVKKSSTIYGRPIDKFLRWSGLSFSDLWDGPDSSRTVWTAKVHPIVTLSLNESFASVFSWLRQFDAESTSRGEGILQEETSLAKWKNCRRLSLSQIRDLSDAPYEFKFREELIIQRFPQIRTSFNEELVKMLLSRYHRTPIDFQFLVDGYVSNATVGQESSSISVGDLIEVFHALDDVIRECMNRDGRQDIGARASMLQCGLLDCLATALLPLNPNAPECSENITSQLSTIMSSLRETLERRKALTNKASDEFNALASVRDELIAAVLMSGIATVGEVMEELASVLTGMHVLAARGMHMSLQTQPPIYDRWIVATAPARIDLSGGWSDTPPICYEFGSLVVGVAVLIDDRKPLLCRCRILPGGTGILLRSESRNSVNGDQIAMLQTEIGNFDGLKDYHDPTSDCALLKCVLVHLGLLRTSSIDNENGDFQANLNGFCRSEGNSVRLEIIATTILPQGSGLGTSSILAGCILAAVGKCIGAGNLSSTEYASEIVDSVLNVEQYLTTGGGFQDQVNGLVGGIKAVSSLPKVYPMKISIENLAVTTNFQLELDNSIVLVFTGKTRLAKNLLKQVLLRWSKQTPEIFDAVSGLVGGAEKCHDAIKSGHLDMLGECLSQYWTYKKVMAGPSSGVEPQVVSDVITSLSMLGLVRGASLCGAGGGGFMVLLCAPGILLSDLQLALQNDPKLDQHSIASFTWHKCRICDEGLDVRQLDNSSGSIDDFDISWLTN